MYPIFDPSKMSDDDLFNKMQEARMYLGHHINLGHDSLVHSMEVTIAVIEEELEARQLKSLADKEKEHRKKMKKLNKVPNYKPDFDDEDEDDNEVITIGHIPGVDD